MMPPSTLLMTSSQAPYLVNPGKGNANLGVKVFFIWGSTCFGCLVFTYFCIPETKGLSLEDIDVLYQNTSPIHSIAYRRRIVAEHEARSASGLLAEKEGRTPEADKGSTSYVENA